MSTNTATTSIINMSTYLTIPLESLTPIRTDTNGLNILIRTIPTFTTVTRIDLIASSDAHLERTSLNLLPGTVARCEFAVLQGDHRLSKTDRVIVVMGDVNRGKRLALYGQAFCPNLSTPYATSTRNARASWS